MCSGGPPDLFMIKTHLAAMRQAFDAAWGGLRAHEPEDNKERKQKMRRSAARLRASPTPTWLNKAIAKWSR